MINGRDSGHKKKNRDDGRDVSFTAFPIAITTNHVRATNIMHTVSSIDQVHVFTDTSADYRTTLDRDQLQYVKMMTFVILA